MVQHIISLVRAAWQEGFKRPPRGRKYKFTRRLRMHPGQPIQLLGILAGGETLDTRTSR